MSELASASRCALGQNAGRPGFSGIMEAIYFDLLEAELFTQLMANPQRLDALIPMKHREWVIIDEIQKIPSLLDEVHRLIEKRRLKFILTGSSARKLKQKGVNLLAGRALTEYLHPLTSIELGSDFNILRALKFGQLPATYSEEDPEKYLRSYISTFLKEEIQQEGLTRNLGAFSRFLEAASFSQASVLNISRVAEECSIERKVVEQYFMILEDLLIATRIPVFTKRAKRKMIAHPKFFFFDAGVFRILRPKGPLDSDAELHGVGFETLVFQELRALNDYNNLQYEIFFWRTSASPQVEVDFVLYGPMGLIAIEVKASYRITRDDLRGLKAFVKDYPMVKPFLVYLGNRSYSENEIEILSARDFFSKTQDILGAPEMRSF